MQVVGLGQLKPNTLFLGYKSEAMLQKTLQLFNFKIMELQLQQQPIYGGGQTFMQQQQQYHVSPQRLVQSILQYYKHYGWSLRLDIRKLRVLRDSFSRIFKGIFQSQCLGNVL